MAFLGGLLAFVGFIALIIAIVGLIRQRLRWTRVIATRRDAAFLLVGAVVAMVVGTVISPQQVKSTPSAQALAAPKARVTAAANPPVAAPVPSAAPSTPASTPSATATASTPAPGLTASQPAVVAAPAPALTIPTQRSYVAPPSQLAPIHTTPPTHAAPRVRTAPPATTGAYNGGGTTDTYTNVDGNQVERPDGSSTGASAKCRDGSYSHSQHRSGTCSGHGGVAQWLNP